MPRPGSSLALSFLAVAALLLVSTPARAQGEAACSWLKIKVVGKGYELDAAGLGPTRSPKAVCYAQLVYVAPSGEFPNGRYTAPLICLHGANEDWHVTDATNGLASNLLDDGNGISDDDYLTFHAENGDVIQGYASHVLRVLRDKKTGAFKKAMWKTLGGQMMDASTFFLTPATVFGGYKASGGTVPAEKVPEGARALASSGMCP